MRNRFYSGVLTGLGAAWFGQALFGGNWLLGGLGVFLFLLSFIVDFAYMRSNPKIK